MTLNNPGTNRFNWFSTFTHTFHTAKLQLFIFNFLYYTRSVPSFSPPISLSLSLYYYYYYHSCIYTHHHHQTKHTQTNSLNLFNKHVFKLCFKIVLQNCSVVAKSRIKQEYAAMDAFGIPVIMLLWRWVLVAPSLWTIKLRATDFESFAGVDRRLLDEQSSL